MLKMFIEFNNPNIYFFYCKKSIYLLSCNAYILFTDSYLFLIYFVVSILIKRKKINNYKANLGGCIFNLINKYMFF